MTFSDGAFEALRNLITLQFTSYTLRQSFPVVEALEMTSDNANLRLIDILR